MKHETDLYLQCIRLSIDPSKTFDQIIELADKFYELAIKKNNTANSTIWIGSEKIDKVKLVKMLDYLDNTADKIYHSPDTKHKDKEIKEGQIYVDAEYGDTKIKVIKIGTLNSVRCEMKRPVYFDNQLQIRMSMNNVEKDKTPTTIAEINKARLLDLKEWIPAEESAWE